MILKETIWRKNYSKIFLLGKRGVNKFQDGVNSTALKSCNSTVVGKESRWLRWATMSHQRMRIELVKSSLSFESSRLTKRCLSFTPTLGQSSWAAPCTLLFAFLLFLFFPYFCSVTTDWRGESRARALTAVEKWSVKDRRRWRTSDKCVQDFKIQRRETVGDGVEEPRRRSDNYCVLFAVKCILLARGFWYGVVRRVEGWA